ncbi:MAG: PQQ-dependent sugar dehydrogenase, partial [Myxococcales bacterium]
MTLISALVACLGFMSCTDSGCGGDDGADAGAGRGGSSGSGGTAGTGAGGIGGVGGAQATVTDLEVAPVLEGLDNPWDIDWLPNGTVLVTERPGRLNVYGAGLDQPPTLVIAPVDLVASGEGGMLGLEVDPSFQSNGYVFVCFCSNESGVSDPDVRVVRYTLSADGGTQLDRTDIVTGMPYSTGRHSGCRPRFGP